MKPLHKGSLPAHSTKDITYLFLGGGLGGGIALYLANRWEFSTLAGLALLTVGFFIGCVAGALFFDSQFQKEEPRY